MKCEMIGMKEDLQRKKWASERMRKMQKKIENQSDKQTEHKFGKRTIQRKTNKFE